MAAFFDSNALLYSVGSDQAKAARSDELLLRGGWISVQVLNEVANVSRRKMRHDWERTRLLLETIQRFVAVAELTRQSHALGLDMAERYRLSIYDGMIVASALLAGCDTLYSEDMHAGLVVDGRLRIVNPFA